MFIAGKRLRIDGQYREPGEPVPEAAGWRRSTLNGLLGSRRLLEVPDDTVVGNHPSTPAPAPQTASEAPVAAPEPEPAPEVVAKLDSVTDITVGEAIKFALEAPPEVVQEMLDEERANKRRTTLIASLTHILEDAGV